MEKIRNLSLRKTIVLYMGISLVLSFLLGAGIVHVAEVTQQQIWWRYVDEEEYYENWEQAEVNYTVSIPRVSNDEMTGSDAFLSEVCDFLQTYGILVVSMAGAVLAVVLFYRNKIKVPLAKLSAASAMIASNQLDFHLDYDCEDELGRLCREFEKMRGELEKNYRRMWRMVEEEKALRSAIAHDIRTPLTILKGYQEMLLEFVPAEDFSREQMTEMLKEGQGQLERLSNFVETMRRLSGLRDRVAQYQEMDIRTLEKLVEASASALEKDGQKEICVAVKEPEGADERINSTRVNRRADTERASGRTVTAEVADRRFLADVDMILEVVENLLSNGVRYASHRVEVGISLDESGEKLEVLVEDDGAGFTVSGEEATRAYFHANPQDDETHFGLGMYISRIYCEKHGGRLLVGNREQGGASVKAVFGVRMGV